MKDRKKSIGKNAAILGIAGIIVKILGAIYRIPITAMIKDEGIGYYQSAYPIYEIMLAITTAGLPVAVATMVSKYIAENRIRDAHKTFQVAFYLMAVLGILFGGLIYIFADTFVLFFKNPGSYYAIVALVPAMILSPMLAAIRGYYQGMQIMTPTAISQIIIQLFRVLSGLYITYLLLPKGYEIAAGGASLGASIGALIGLIYMVYVHIRHRKLIDFTGDKSKSVERKSLLKEMAIIALPISLGAAVIPIMDFIDIRLVMNGLLASGFNEAMANLRFGWLKGMAQTLIGLPQVIAIAIGVSIIPVLSGLKALHETEKMKEKVESVLKFTFLIALPCTVGLFVLSKPIVQLLYPTTGIEAINGTARILKILSIEVVPLMSITVITSILQAISKERIPVYNLLIGAIFKIILTIYLIRIPSINIYGAAIASLIAFLITFILDFYKCKEYIRFNLNKKMLLPLLNSVIMGVCVYFSYYQMARFGISNKLITLIAVFVGAVIYALFTLITKAIDINEIREMKRKN